MPTPHVQLDQHIVLHAQHEEPAQRKTLHKGHHFVSSVQPRAIGTTPCAQCGAQIRHGCRQRVCQICGLTWCPSCFNTHSTIDTLRPCETTQPLAIADIEDVTSRSEMSLLGELCEVPADRTLTYAPRGLRQRIAWILQKTIHDAIQATKHARKACMACQNSSNDTVRAPP